MVLNQVQIFDQEIAAARRVAEQRGHLLLRLGINSPRFRSGADARAFAFGGAHWTD